ncbi:MAG: PAS domain S-box protein [Chitinivibrionales bacterium]|nr:PAS domain S-box protein [Chitinivibrionales bacterium]
MKDSSSEFAHSKFTKDPHAERIGAEGDSSEARFKAIWNQAEVGLMLIDSRHHVIIDANPMAQSLAGRMLDDIVGKECHHFICNQQKGTCPISDLGRKLDRSESEIVRADGVRVPVLKTVTPMTLHGREVLLESFIDISERLQADRQRKAALIQSEKSRRETEALLEGTKAVLNGCEFSSTARKLFGLCRLLADADAGFVALLGEDGSRQAMVFLEPGGMSWRGDDFLPAPVRDLVGRVYTAGRTVYENGVIDSQQVESVSPLHSALESILLAPVKIDGASVGIMGLANKPGGFGAQDARLCEAFCELAAVALRNTRNRQKLSESESGFRTLFEEAPDAYYLNDMKGRFIASNKAAEKMTGYDRAEMTGKTFKEAGLLSRADEMSASHVLKANRAGKSSGPHEFTLKCKNGEHLPVEIITQPLRLFGEALVLGVARDISGRRNAENDLREREKGLKEAQRLANIGNWTWKPDAGEVYLSDEMYRIIGLPHSPDSLSFANHEKYYTPETWQRFLSVVENARVTGEPYEIELEIIRENAPNRIVVARGEQVLDENSQLLYLRGTLQDITEREHAKKQIEQLSRFPDENPNPVVRIDTHGTILYANKASGPLLESWEVSVNQQISREWLEDLLDIFASGDKREIEHVADDCIYSLTVAPVSEHNYVNIYGLDVTESRALEEQARHSQRMEAIGQLAGGVAHDFNNILGGIIGYCDVISLKADPGESGAYIKKIKHSAQNAAHLTRQLLSFARKARVEMNILGVHALVANVKDLLERTIDKRITVSSQFEATRDSIEADAGQLESVLLNIGLNARDALPEGGDIVFGTRNITITDTDAAYGTFTLAPGQYIRIDISDTGTGMDEATKKRIFEPFFTTKEPGKGTGLGLASVYGTIKQHHGYITVKSKQDHGCTFAIYLPLAGVDAHCEAQSLPAVSRNGKGTVLLVDDDELLLDSSMNVLVSCGYEVLAASNGERGVQVYRENRSSIDAVVMDVIMPGLSGLECFLKLKSLNNEVKAIAISGYSDYALQAQLKEAGVVAFVGKPYEGADLVRALQEILPATKNWTRGE